MKYDLLIFDFDGTLADSYCWFASHLNVVAEKYNFRTVKADEQNMLRQLHARQIAAHLGVAKWKLPVVVAHMQKMMSRDIESIRLFDGVSALLEKLNRSGIELGIVSSNRLANVEKVLGIYSQLISHKQCGVSLFGKSRKIRAILRNSKIRPEKTLYLGDELRDTEAAQDIGLDVCAVTWGYNLRVALAGQNPTYIVDQLADIADLVNVRQ